MGCPARASIVWTIRSNSSFLTSSPFTRAMTGGSCAGTGLGGVAAGGCPGIDGGAPGVAAAGACWVAVLAVPVDCAGALRHAPAHTAVSNTQTSALDLTDTSEVQTLKVNSSRGCGPSDPTIVTIDESATAQPP